MLCGSNDEINFPHTLLLTERQASATDAATQNKIYRSGLTNTDNLKWKNEKFLEIVKHIEEESSLLNKSVSKTVSKTVRN